MSAADTAPAPVSAPGLLGKLMASVRPEFRVDILIPGRGALVFDTAPCRVPGCVRQPRTRGLCKGHYYKWKDQGRPDIEVFAATAAVLLHPVDARALAVLRQPSLSVGGRGTP